MEETYERNGLKVTILPDENPESPREWDNVGVMICSHREYNLGDEQFDSDDYDGWDDLKAHLIADEDAVVILPLNLHDHSGISMSIGSSRGWDNGQVGFIYITKEMATAQYGTEYTKEMLEEVLRGEVETYNQYLTGDVWGYTVENPKTGEIVDSLWGMYGFDYAKEEADAVADAYKHPQYVTEPVPYEVFKELFKTFNVNPFEFKQLSGDKVMGYFPNLKQRESTISVENLAKVIWGEEL